MRIRPARPDDVPAVVDLEQQLFGPDAWSVAATADELGGPGRRAVVACTEGPSTGLRRTGSLRRGSGQATSIDGPIGEVQENRVVGYAVSRVAGDVADLHRIAVAPEHRRSGVARALLDELRRAARDDGATRMLLEVGAGNQEALAFYAAEGFTEIDRRPRYYRDGSDALVLRASVGAPSCGGAAR